MQRVYGMIGMIMSIVMNGSCTAGLWIIGGNQQQIGGAGTAQFAETLLVYAPTQWADSQELLCLYFGIDGSSH